jgi:hypothetical protein
VGRFWQDRANPKSGGTLMRLTRLVPAALFLCVAVPSFAQQWTEYTSRVDRFTVNFPGEPTVRDITWPSEYGAVFPGRVYSHEAGGNRYSVTVIDYTDAERIHAGRAKPEAFSSDIYWQIDVQASIDYAATKFRQREGVKVTFDAWHYIDLVSGHQLQLTNPDQSRTFAGIYLHENRLYILEGTVSPRAAPPGLFQQSLSFLDEAGNRVRYNSIYFNRLPPSRLGRGRGAQAQ